MLKTDRKPTENGTPATDARARESFLTPVPREAFAAAHESIGPLGSAAGSGEGSGTLVCGIPAPQNRAARNQGVSFAHTEDEPTTPSSDRADGPDGSNRPVAPPAPIEPPAPIVPMVPTDPVEPTVVTDSSDVPAAPKKRKAKPKQLVAGGELVPAVDASGIATLGELDRKLVEALDDPMESGDAKDISPELAAAGAALGLSKWDLHLVKSWVINGGFLPEAFKQELTPDAARHLNASRKRPAVRNLLQRLSDAGLCASPVATKDELAEGMTQFMRSPLTTPDHYLKTADALAQLMGYYPKDSRTSFQANVQINLVNPYGGEE